jgi:phosphatidylethanolamine/phosphatidyl-N-methylethanolamine N-methyltransferase
MSGQELQQAHTPDDFSRFFKSWIRNPLAMGAFAPSGRSLAKLMAKGVEPGARVLELGAGTGTVTEALLAKGVHAADLYVVERDPQLVEILERRFPRCHVICADALTLAERFAAGPSFDFVISGLPLVLFSADNRMRVLQQAFDLLKPSGRFHQFTYAGRCPIDRQLRSALHAESVLMGIAAINLPPAFVYRLTRIER